MIGRVSRLDTATSKGWFRIIDSTVATRLFDELDRPSVERPVEVTGPRTAGIEGTVIDADSGALIVGASVSALIGLNEQQGPFRSNWDGRFRFTRLPAGTVRLSVGGAGCRRRQVPLETAADTVQRA